MQDNHTLYFSWQASINEQCKLSGLPLFFPTKTKQYNLRSIFDKIAGLNNEQLFINSFLTTSQLLLLATATQYNIPLPDLSNLKAVDWDNLHNQILSQIEEKERLTATAKMYGLQPDLYSLDELREEIIKCEEEAEEEWANERRWQHTVQYSTKL